MKILITGTRSGFGAFLANDWFREGHDVTEFTRDSEINDLVYDDPYFDLIVHCAWDQSRSVVINSLPTIYANNVELTQKLLRVRCERFVFMSTVDVYPAMSGRYLAEKFSLYALQKLMCEEFVKRKPSSTILRCSSLIGPTMRKNNLIKAMVDHNPVLTVTPDSVFNCVSYYDVAKFIDTVFLESISGTFDVVSADSVRISDICESNNVTWGSFQYKCPDTPQDQNYRLFISESSKAVLENYKRSIQCKDHPVFLSSSPLF